MKVPPILKALIALCLFFLAINGVLEKSISPLLRIDQVIEDDQEFLKKSMVSSVKHFIVLSTCKGGLAAIRDSTFLGIALGKVVTPFSETVHFLWKIFGISMLSITFQLSLLKFFNLISLNILFSSGAIIYAVSFGHIEILKRVGTALMISGLVLYILIPYSIYTSQKLFEKNSEAVNIQLNKDLQTFKQGVDDIKLFSFRNFLPGNARRIKASLSEKLNIVFASLSKYFINLLIMFVITPVFFYGVIYFVIRKVLDCIGMQPVIVKIDEGVFKGLRKL
jgi:hypothetical protein